MSAKETLGYPSRTAAVLALRAQGKTPEEVGATIGISRNAVSGLEASAARREARAGHKDGTGRSIILSTRILDKLTPASAARGVTPNKVARLILEAVIGDNLIDAVLDDADQLPGAH